MLEEEGRGWSWSRAWEPWGQDPHRKVLAAELGLETSLSLLAREQDRVSAVPQPLTVFKTTKALFML